MLVCVFVSTCSVLCTVSSVGHGGVSQDGTFLSVGKRFLDPRGSERRASKKSDLGRWMAALGPLVLGAWPGRPSTKAGNG